MEIDRAIELLQNGIAESGPASWAELGAGEGLFSRALSKLLAPGSTILAIDKRAEPLDSLKSVSPGVEILTLVADFRDLVFEPHSYDGIIMANSLHFVEDKAAMVAKIRSAMKSNGRLILIEYDLDTPNPWVPYPISFQSLNQFLSKSSLSPAALLGETASVYQKANIYSAMVVF